VACAASKTDGADGDCSNVTAGTDPDGECGLGELCDGAGVCKKKSVGADCSSGNECESTYCADEICCATACTGNCEACSNAITGLADGTCGPVPVGDDPDQDCAANERCDGGSLCICGWVVAPPGGASCPPQCSSCNMTTHECTISCSQANECANSTLNCPPGWDCTVACAGEESCRGATVNCPAGYACAVNCTCGGNVPSCCHQLQINCGVTGACEVFCGNGTDACLQTVLACGDNQCVADCVSQVDDKPALQCNNSCNCVPC
jgi:hypothetical protein